MPDGQPKSQQLLTGTCLCGIAASCRRWIEIRDAIVAFILAHRYSLSIAATILVGAAIVALVKLWLRLRRLYMTACRHVDYTAVPQQETSDKEGKEASDFFVEISDVGEVELNTGGKV
jgi:hypothetical protein